MKLYNLDHSPYATRARILLRKKGLDADICPPPLALRTPEFLEKFPLGKIPILELDDGTHIPESVVIMEYLEEAYPDHQVQPAEPLARAQMRLMTQYTDTHLSHALFPLFLAAGKPDVDAAPLVEALLVELSKLDRLLASMKPYRERDVHHGDISLAPILFYVIALGPLFGIKDILKGYDTIGDWWNWANGDPEIGTAINEMDRAYKAFMDKK